MHKIHKKFFGFTLIELLFVIAIIGVLASLGVSLMQKKTEEFKVKKVALQLQYILQAGLSYYVDNNKWPLWGVTVTCVGDFCPKYIGQGIKADPWGLDYYYWNDTSDTDFTGRFYVNVKLPNSEIAQRVAAQLPYAEFCKTYYDQNCTGTPSDDKPWVRAYVSVPGQAVQQAPVQIQTVGTRYVSISGGGDTTKCVSEANVRFHCGGGKQANLLFAIYNYYHYGRVQGANLGARGDLGYAYPKLPNNKTSYCGNPDNQGNVSCGFDFCVTRSDHTPTVTDLRAGVTVFGICADPGAIF